MKDIYSSYRELAGDQAEGTDFRIVSRAGRSDIVVMAIHGGGIEPATDLLADAIAGQLHGYYAFIGLKPSGNRELHLASTCFDEPRGVASATEARRVVSIHGSNIHSLHVGIGGKDEVLKKRLAAGLANFGGSVETLRGGTQGGMHPNNICNRCQRRAGVQLEISRKLRERMFPDFPDFSGGKKTAAFIDFVDRVRSVLGVFVSDPAVSQPSPGSGR